MTRISRRAGIGLTAFAAAGALAIGVLLAAGIAGKSEDTTLDPVSSARPARTTATTSPTTSGPDTAARWSVAVPDGAPMGVSADSAGIVAVSYREVHALDPADGSELWHTAIGSAPDIAPVRAAVDATTVAVPTSTGVVVLDRSDGKVRWQARLGGGDAGDPGPVALAVARDGSPLVLATTDHGTVTAFDATSGTPKWSVTFEGAIRSAAQIDAAAGVAVLAWHVDGGEGHARALDLASGSVRWDVPTLEKTAAPVVHAGLALLSEGDNLSHARVRALDAATGAVRWETAVPKSFEWETEPAAEGDDYVTVDHFGTVTSVDVHTGAIRWQHSDDWALLDTRVLLTGRAVAFHDFAGHVVVLDRATGAVRSAARPGGAVVDAAVRGDLLVSVVSRDVASRFEARPVP